jgi:hypothetical protein
MQHVDYPGIHERNESIVREHKRNIIIGSFMAVGVIVGPMLLVRVVSLLF